MFALFRQLEVILDMVCATVFRCGKLKTKRPVSQSIPPAFNKEVVKNPAVNDVKNDHIARRNCAAQKFLPPGKHQTRNQTEGKEKQPDQFIY